MKRFLLCTAAALLIAATPADAGGNGGKTQSTNVNLNLTTGKGGVLGTVLGTLKGQNGLNVNANVTTGKGGILGTILGGK